MMKVTSVIAARLMARTLGRAVAAAPVQINKSKWHQGEQERARRMRQLQTGHRRLS
jgi:hypothetical protein